VVLAGLLPPAAPPGPLPVLREQAERLFGALLGNGDRESFLRLNPFLTLLAGAAWPSDAAMKLLRDAVNDGGKEVAHMKKETDLAPLRELEVFQKLVAELEGKAK
jgi:hypothetical protein